MYEQILSQIGLQPDQALIYEILLKNGPLKASKISKKSPIKRELVYKILGELVETGLVIKNEPKGKVAVFEPAHPVKLKELAESREQKMKTAQSFLDGIFGQLTSDYNLNLMRPGVQFYEGIDGLKNIYDDILRTNQDYFLIRSVYNPGDYNDQIYQVVSNFVKKRIAKKIKATVLAPVDEPKNKNINLDVERRQRSIQISKKDYDSPVEMDIYGTKIAILSFGKELMGIIIDSPQISKALTQLFTIIQKSTENRH